jgi:hypothetical protein
VAHIVELIAVVLIPTAAMYALLFGLRGVRWITELFYSRAAQAAGPAESTERLTANLRRLRAELELTEASHGIRAKAHRVRAVRGAYVDALCTACQRFEVSPPAGGEHAKLTDIYRVEAALRQRGLDVRETVVR